MRTRYIAVLFFLLIMSTFAVAQSTTSGSSTGSSSGSNNSGSFLSSPNSGIQVPSTSGVGNVTVNPTTPSTLMFNSQNLNSPAAIDSSSGTPTIDQIVSSQSDLISSTESFLNPTTDATTNTRTSTSNLGEAIFGNAIVPGMTTIPIVSVVPSTGTTNTVGTTTTNPTSVNPQ